MLPANDWGLGRDVWGFKSAEEIVRILKLFYAFQFGYTLTLGFVKMSITYLYLRLFPDRGYRRYLWGTQVFNVLIMVTWVLLYTFQCTPRSVWWDRALPMPMKGKCLNINAIGWVHAIINILLDIWMLALPASQVLKLQMAWGQKLRVLSMFGLGILYVLTETLLDQRFG